MGNHNRIRFCKSRNKKSAQPLRGHEEPTLHTVTSHCLGGQHSEGYWARTLDAAGKAERTPPMPTTTGGHGVEQGFGVGVESGPRSLGD